MARVRYNRGSLESAINAARKTCGDRANYVFATALGYTIDRQPPPFRQQHFLVRPDGSFQYMEYETIGE